MANFDNIIDIIIERIVSEYTGEIQMGDRQERLVASVGATPAITLENYKRQKQLHNTYKEQQDILRRVLRRVVIASDKM